MKSSQGVNGSEIFNLRTLQDEVPGIELRLSTAVMLSARFPYLTPAGSYVSSSKERSNQKHLLVDGGYFDNTGIETALDLIHLLESEAKTAGLQVRFIMLSISAEGSQGSPVYSFSEIMSPVRTMVATWRSRGPISVRNAKRELNGREEMRFRRAHVFAARGIGKTFGYGKDR